MCETKKMCMISFVMGGMMVAGVCAYKANKYRVDRFVKDLCRKTQDIVHKVKSTTMDDNPTT